MTDVYRNRVRRVWSVRESGLVVAHVDAVCLYDVSFHVSEAARQRAIRLGQRAVLAFARGKLIDAPLQGSSELITFDPFTGPHFEMGDFIIKEASLVHFLADGSCWGVL
ncbi:hypothetical protein B2G69_07765 [Methylorubrum zatmanii]|nr:hypothetical protein [Methylorubrum zatmanii]ARO54051.1 hypothetical protein B2G69_07765 [Methylorubrum zatmanii]